MSSAQLTALLAIPATIRPLLYDAAFGAHSLRSLRVASSPSAVATFSATASASKKKKAAVPILTKAIGIPEYATSPPVPLKMAQLVGEATLNFEPDIPFEKAFEFLFTKTPAAFHHGNPNFYDLPKNTRTPEVCLLGRSNCGKSSFINSLANRNGSPLAFVSKTAGFTKALNMYGFGPVPSAEKGEVVVSDEYKGKEEMPQHRFFVVDMPGYGHKSLDEWGKNIALYLQKRTALKGVVMLIDAGVGPKESDWEALELVANEGIRTIIALTKVDKLKGQGEELLQVSKTLWDGLRRIDARLAEENKRWDWDRAFYVTACGSKNSASRSETRKVARMAVVRLAGLVKEAPQEEVPGQKWSGKIVSFDELYGSSAEIAQNHRLQSSAHAKPTISENEAKLARLRETIMTPPKKPANKKGSKPKKRAGDWKPKRLDQIERRAARDGAEALSSLEARKLLKRVARRRAVENDPNQRTSSAPKGATRADYEKLREVAAKGSLAPRAGIPRSELSNRGRLSVPQSGRGGKVSPSRPLALPRNPLSELGKLEAFTAAQSYGQGRGGRTGRTRRSPPRASFFHTSAQARTHGHIPGGGPQSNHPLSKEELDAVLADFIATLNRPDTLQDKVRQRKLDMEQGVGQPSPEEMRAEWAERLQKNKEDLAQKYKNQTRLVQEVRERRLAIEDDKMRRAAALRAEQERLEADTDWVAVRKQRRAEERARKQAQAEAARDYALSRGTHVQEIEDEEEDQEDEDDDEDDERVDYWEEYRHLRGANRGSRQRQARGDEDDDAAPKKKGGKKASSSSPSSSSSSKKGKKEPEMDEFDKKFAKAMGGGGSSKKGQQASF